MKTFGVLEIMETSTTKKTKRSTKGKVDEASKIENAYKEYVLIHGKKPSTVFKFMHDLKMKEKDFYLYFGSFTSVESQIWEKYFNDTVDTLRKDSEYQDYLAREKLLAFYFTLLEVLKQDRSFVLHSINSAKNKADISLRFIKNFKSNYIRFIQELVEEGITKEEIMKRPVLTERYKDALWLQLLFVLRFWSKDESAGFTKSDAAIEKSVNLSFELMGRGPLDMMVDFAKFLFHNR